VQVVTAPHESRNLGSEIKQSLRHGGIVGYATRAFDGLAEIRDGTVVPTPDLIAEDAQASCPPGTHGTFGDDAPLVAVSVGDRRLLDHIPTVGHVDFKRGVVEVAPAATMDRRVKRLVDEAVQPDEVTTCAQRQPEEVGRGQSSRCAVTARGRGFVRDLYSPSCVTRARPSARCLMPRSIFRSITSEAGSIGSIPRRAIAVGSRNRLRLINRVPPP
jgi:hypothetical protein